MAEPRYQCTFCGTRFVHEDRYLRHRCKEMIKHEQFNSADGHTAWLYYQKWLKEYNRFVPNSKSFLQSKFFNSFYKFATFAKKVNLPDIATFIRLMKSKDISPTIWTDDRVYALYIEHLDRVQEPSKHAEISINTLFDEAEKLEVDVSVVFDSIQPGDVIQLIRQRKLSPWVLLNSPKFKDFYVKRTSSEEKVVLESIIRPSYWKKKFEEHPKDLLRMKKYITELHL